MDINVLLNGQSLVIKLYNVIYISYIFVIHSHQYSIYHGPW